MRKQHESIKPRIERLAQKFNDGERFTREEIGQELGIKPNSINSYLNQLSRYGILLRKSTNDLGLAVYRKG
jgi:DNA-binding GntR family transcriptional regulator